jgi:hypothetical protein
MTGEKSGNSKIHRNYKTPSWTTNESKMKSKEK